MAARYGNKLAVYDGPSRATYASTSNASCASGTRYTSELGLSRGDVDRGALARWRDLRAGTRRAE